METKRRQMCIHNSFSRFHSHETQHNHQLDLAQLGIQQRKSTAQINLDSIILNIHTIFFITLLDFITTRPWNVGPYHQIQMSVKSSPGHDNGSSQMPMDRQSEGPAGLLDSTGHPIESRD